jgi:hypothetical protein
MVFYRPKAIANLVLQKSPVELVQLLAADMRRDGLLLLMGLIFQTSNTSGKYSSQSD